MKKLLIASTIAALSIGTASAEVGISGQVRADMKYTGNTEKDDSSKLVMDQTYVRAGISGDMPLDAEKSISTIYKAEVEKKFNEVDEEGKKVVGVDFRDAYVGIKGDQLGTLTAGRMGSAQDAILFGEPPSWASGFGGYDEGRTDKTIRYTTPSYDGIQASGQIVVDPENKHDTEFGVNAHYQQEGIKAGISYVGGVQDNPRYVDEKEEVVDISRKGKKFGAVRLGTQLDVIPQVTLKGYYQFTDFSTNDNENAYAVSAEYDIPNSPLSVYGQVDGIENAKGNKSDMVNMGSVGGYYKLNKATTGRFYAGMNDSDDYVFGTGLTHKF